MKIQIPPFSEFFTVVKYREGLPLYVRYGLWGRRSTNYSTGEEEIGVSVYRARIERCAAHIHPEEEVSNQLKGQGRIAWLVTGIEVGTGSDGEPLLRQLKLVWGPALSVFVRRV